MKVYANLGEMLFIDLSDELTENTLEDEGEIPCNSSMNFVYDDCAYAAITDKLISEFGCVVPWLPPPPSQAKICKFSNASSAELEYKAKVMERYDFLSSSGLRDLCQLPCAFMEVFLGESREVA